MLSREGFNCGQLTLLREQGIDQRPSVFRVGRLIQNLSHSDGVGTAGPLVRERLNGGRGRGEGAVETGGQTGTFNRGQGRSCRAATTRPRSSGRCVDWGRRLRAPCAAERGANCRSAT